MVSARMALVVDKVLQQFRPPPNLTVSEFADKHRILSTVASSEPGPWDTNRVPFQRGIMDAVNDCNADTIVIMSSAQVGKTEVLLNTLLYQIAQTPSPCLVVMPTLEMSSAFSKDRLSPMIQETKLLRGLFNTNSVLHKSYPGGHITMSGANSPSSLSSRPVKVLLCDEIDRFPASAGNEGDPLNLARKRTQTFHDKKIVVTSTPTIKSTSRIYKEYLTTDMREYLVPCPHCGNFHKLEWKNVKFTRDEEDRLLDSWMECPNCQGRLEESHKKEMLAGGHWEPSAKAKNPKSIGFHINELYSPWSRLEDMVQSFLLAKGDKELLKTFVNTSLGEPFEDVDEGKETDIDGLLLRKEDYNSGSLPNDILLITAGVDVQKDRIEMEIVGWGETQSWGIDYRVVHGDPQSTLVWAELDKILATDYVRNDGVKLSIEAMSVDSGFLTTHVYDYVAPRQTRRVYAIKGKAGQQEGVPLVGKPSLQQPSKVRLYNLGTMTGKDIIYGQLAVEDITADGYMHFPETYDENYFEMLTAEVLTTKYVSGQAKRFYKQIRARNEALDVRVYALAAKTILNPQWNALKQNIDKQKERLSSN